MLPTAAHAATAAAAAAVPIKDTIVAIYSLLGSLLVHEEPFIANKLETLDLSARVRVVGALLKDLDSPTKFKSIELAKQDLANVLEDMKAALEKLHARTKTYREAFFASWRYGAALQASLQTVVALSRLLERRLATLIMLLPLKD